MSEHARRAQRQPPVGVNMDKFAPDKQVSGRSLTRTSHGAWRPEHDLWPLSRAATLHWGRSLSRRRAEDTGASVGPAGEGQRASRGGRRLCPAPSRRRMDFPQSHSSQPKLSVWRRGVCVCGGAPRGSPHSAPGSFHCPHLTVNLCEFLGMSLFLRLFPRAGDQENFDQLKLFLRARPG